MKLARTGATAGAIVLVALGGMAVPASAFASDEPLAEEWVSAEDEGGVDTRVCVLDGDVDNEMEGDVGDGEVEEVPTTEADSDPFCLALADTLVCPVAVEWTDGESGEGVPATEEPDELVFDFACEDVVGETETARGDAEVAVHLARTGTAPRGDGAVAVEMAEGAPGQVELSDRGPRVVEIAIPGEK